MQAGQFERAQLYFSDLKELEPRSGRVRAALVRAAQGAQNFAARDAERKELFRLRQSGEDPELGQEEYYVRDEFTILGSLVSALEFFELDGDRAVRYVFEVSGPDSTEPEYLISLGSYTATNAIWRATQDPQPAEGERLFHLDGYFPDGTHVTFGMHYPEPSYDEVRGRVVGIIEERASR
jgi:hypothetical protein